MHDCNDGLCTTHSAVFDGSFRDTLSSLCSHPLGYTWGGYALILYRRRLPRASWTDMISSLHEVLIGDVDL